MLEFLLFWNNNFSSSIKWCTGESIVKFFIDTGNKNITILFNRHKKDRIIAYRRVLQNS